MNFRDQSVLHFLKLSDKAYTPTRSTPASIGLDLRSPTIHLIPPKTKACIPLDLVLRIPDGYYGQIASRSGLAVNDDVVVEAGVIDPDYTGNVAVILRNHGDGTFVVNLGDRIAQLILIRAATPIAQEVTLIPSTFRGASGFGSTEQRDYIPTAKPL